MYEINLVMLRGYLETLEPTGIAGLTGNAFQCPVARAAKHRYGIPFVVSQTAFYPKENSEEFAIPPEEIAELISALDSFTPALLGFGKITRAEVEQVLERIGL